MIRRVPDFHRQVLAVNRVERLLRKVTGALDAGGVPYAVIGGNAVAAWVATVDRGAVRATKDVDILLRRDDLEAAAAALRPAALDFHEVAGVAMFLTRRNPNPRTGAHVLFSGECVRQSDLYPAPDVVEGERAEAGYRVIALAALLRMKLVSFRDIDRVHVRDLLSLDLIDEDLINSLPDELRKRLDQIRATQ